MAGETIITVVGNLTADPELRFTPSGVAMAKIRLAVNRRWRDQSGEWQENTSFFTGTPAGGGTYRIRIGTGGGNLVLDNPGTSLGTGTEARLTAPTSASSNKLSVYGWDSPSNFAYVKLKLRTTSTGNGIFSFNLARSIAGSSNNNISGDLSQSLSVVRFSYSAGVLSVARRDGSNYVDVTGSGLAKDTDNDVEIYGNNSGSATYYHRDGANYNLDAQSWDLWVDGVKVSPASGWPRSGTSTPPARPHCCARGSRPTRRCAIGT